MVLWELLGHKVLDSISEIKKATKLKEKVEADETYESINLKGTKPKNMLRASTTRSSKGLKKRHKHSSDMYCFNNRWIW